MTVRGEHFEIWREDLDTDTNRVWDNIQEETAPPLRRPFRSAVNIRPWRWAAAAAVVALLLSGLWNAVLLQELENVRTDYVIAMLKTDSPLSQLTTLDTLRSDRAVERRHRSPAATGNKLTGSEYPASCARFIARARHIER